MAYSTILKPEDYFNTKLYTGTGASSQAQTGVGFQPDFVWIKSRSSAEGHVLADAVRGATKYLISNTTSAEVTNTDTVKSFDSDGYTIGPAGVTGGNGVTFASWNWKANGTGSSNTEGSINTTATSANTTSGFSIVTYTGNGTAGATIGHGLGKVPTFIIFRRYAQAENWGVYHKSIGAAKSVRLNETGAEADDTTALNSTAPTSSLITLGTNATTNVNTNPYIAWCFSDVQGFSKAGSYTGNGNADGTFVYTGFKPAWVLIKDSGRAESWFIFDNRRLGYNGAMASLTPNTSATETSSSATLLDLVSNGFKLTGTTDHLNGSGQNFIYMAFAENPFVANSGESIPTTAR